MADRRSNFSRKLSALLCPIVAAALFWAIAVPARGGGGSVVECNGPGGQTYDPAIQKCCGSVAVPMDQSCCSVPS